MQTTDEIHERATDVLILEGAGLPAPSDLSERVRRIVDEATPENTKKAYASDMRYVRAWCEASGVAFELPLSTDDVVRFLVEHVDGLHYLVEHRLVEEGAKRGFGKLAVSTLQRRFMSLSSAHNLGGHPNPCADKRVLELMQRIRRGALMAGWKPRKKAAAHAEILEPMLAACGDGISGVRDRALVLFAFSSGGRRASEVSSAEVERLERIGEDYVYHLGLTKTEKDGDSGPVPVAGRAARAIDEWLEVSGVSTGPLFRAVDRWGHVGSHRLSPEGVRNVVKRLAGLAGHDPRRFGAHSLRSGFMTETGLRGVNLAEAMALSRHRSVQVASGYHEAGAGLRNRAARILD